MKKVLFCLSIMSLILFCSCKKEKKNNYADPFVGNYDVLVDASLNVPILGAIPLNFEEEGTIAKNGDEGDVTITVRDQSISGYARADGLHIDPVVITQNIAGYDMNVTIATAVIAPPVDGVIHTTATLSASVSLGTVNGTAEITATRR